MIELTKAMAARRQLLIHTHPPLCFQVESDDVLVRVSRDIEEVTCPVCVYYWFTPEARNLEIAFRARRERHLGRDQ